MVKVVVHLCDAECGRPVAAPPNGNWQLANEEEHAELELCEECSASLRQLLKLKTPHPRVLKDSSPSDPLSLAELRKIVKKRRG